MAGRVANLENGMPTVEVALRRMEQELRTARACGTPYVKLVHGYGSSGRGGAIKEAVLKKLASLKNAGRISLFVSGEDFTPFCAAAREMLARCPELARDRDLAMANHGITVVLL